ncbi:MAG: preprotein translocase subunit SecA [Candidatus Magasanikbacteria bacterium]|nr:preprotein translocase subunit SecA [Candidatus Magasanikbacteria bacterium]
MMSFLTKIFGDPNAKVVQGLQPMVEKINNLEPTFSSLSDEALKAKTKEFKERLSHGETLDDILPEAFATVREASKRTTGMRHFDVQMIGGMVLHQGKIAEMRTGEGKTLVATLPVYLNALAGKGVHLVTVNDYLARRDAVWMGQIYNFLGLTVGVIQNQRVSYMYDTGAKAEDREGGDVDKERDELGSFKIEYDYLRPCSRQETYRADITYGTNNEFGFDYLRDNMVQNLSDQVMRPGSEMVYAIVDEIDSILIDEARTPLIISAPAEEATEQYYRFATLVRNLKKHEDYNVDEKMRSATLTEAGIAKFEQMLGIENLYIEGGIQLVHHVEQALKAEVLFKRDKEYVVDGNEIVIIDEFTGRKMPGRRYSEGLHQAIEAKEKLPVQRESQTLATITFQNLFRMYEKLGGMTGTAVTEAEEFGKIYNLEVVVVPTNKKDSRGDFNDQIFKNEAGKFKAIVERIKESRAKNQPILIGTISVEKNEQLSDYLTANGITHEILNAKNHEREGEIIAQAGRPGAVTLATNMAGRGVDIKLGGVPANPKDVETVVTAGGLFVLGTERHESRRIDNQLRGRAARQGDPGETQFMVSTDDELMRIFAGDRLKNVMTRLNVPDDMPIEQGMITKLLESAQRKVENYHFDTRKHLLDYDDVLNRHRQVIYKKRKNILELVASQVPFEAIEAVPDKKEPDTFIVQDESEEPEKNFSSLKEMILDFIEQEIELLVSFHTNMVNAVQTTDSNEEKNNWDMQPVVETVKTIFSLSPEQTEHVLTLGKSGSEKLDQVKAREEIVTYLLESAKNEYKKIEEQVVNSLPEKEKGLGLMREIEKSILLRAIDTLWVDHLVAIDYLRTGIGLRGYGQRDPLVEYKKETYQMFQSLQSSIQKEIVYSFFKVGLGFQFAPTIMANDKLTLTGAEKELNAKTESSGPGHSDSEKKIGRNDPCYCGSGKKYKKCHGA